MKKNIPLFYPLIFTLAFVFPGVAPAKVEIYTLSASNGNLLEFPLDGGTVMMAISGEDAFTVCRQDGVWLSKFGGFVVGPFQPSISTPNVSRRIGGSTALQSDGTLRIFNSVSDQPTQINPFGGDVRGNVFVYHLDLSLNDLLNAPMGVPVPNQLRSTETRIQINSIYAVKPRDVATTGGVSTVNLVWQLTKIADVDVAPSDCRSSLARSVTPVTTPAAPQLDNTPPADPVQVVPAPVVAERGDTTPVTTNPPAPAAAESSDGGGAMVWSLALLMVSLLSRRGWARARI